MGGSSSSKRGKVKDEDTKAAYQKGQRVVLTPVWGVPELGTVRYFGNDEVVTLGIRLDAAGGAGNCDGRDPETGQLYFRCEEGKGVFVKGDLSCVQPVLTPSPEAVTALRRLALALEVLDEQETLQRMTLGTQAQISLLANGIGESASWATAYRKIWDYEKGRYWYYLRSDPAGRRVPVAPRGVLVLPAEGGPDDSIDKAIPEGLPILKDDEVLSPEDAQKIFEHCHQNWWEPPPCCLMLKLARATLELFRREPTVGKLSTPPDGKAVVVGDLHGHFKDLVFIWSRDGLPNADTAYVFTGNICDRGDSKPRGGQSAVQIWACILSFKLAFPGSVHVNRGNHESYSYSVHNRSSSFHGEIFSKYVPEEAHALATAFGTLCDMLPLATVIDEKVLVLHGGLPRVTQRPDSSDLREISQIRRPLQLQSLPRNRVETIVADILWADPQDIPGIGPSARSEGLTCFGPDANAEFLGNNGLSLLVRSHLIPEGDFSGRGYEWWHPVEECTRVTPPRQVSPEQEGYCISVFSASDYCGYAGGNMGGTVIFNGSTATDRGERYLQLEEHTSMEADMKLKGSQPYFATQSELHALARANVTLELVALVAKHRHMLLEEFFKLDEDGKGVLTLENFYGCCHRVLPGVPWEQVVPGVSSVLPDKIGNVCYMSFLSRYRCCLNNADGSHDRLRETFASRLYGEFMMADHALRAMLQQPGADLGRVPTELFLQAFSRTCWIMHTSQVKMMMRSLKVAKGTISLDEFLGSLRVEAFVPAKLDALVRDILAEVSRGQPNAARKGVTALLRHFFESIDQTATGVVDAAQLAAALKPLPSAEDLSDQQLQAMAKYMGADDKDEIDYGKLLATLDVVHKGAPPPPVQQPGRGAPPPSGKQHPGHGQEEQLTPPALLEDMLEAVLCIIVFEYGFGTMRRLIHLLTPPGSVRCTPELFRQVLLALSAGQVTARLSGQQIDCLIDSLVLGENGDFDFEAYFAAFEIVDQENGLALKCG